MDVTGTIIDGSGTSWRYIRYRSPIPSEAKAAPYISPVDMAYAIRDGQLLGVQPFLWLDSEFCQEMHRKEPVFTVKVDAIPEPGMVRIVLPSSIKQGERWSHISEPGRELEYEITAIGQTVTILAGTFEDVIVVRCQVNHADVNGFIDTYYARGIGIIRQKQDSVTNVAQAEKTRMIIVYELSSYRIP
jgi:hypothetical protein